MAERMMSVGYMAQNDVRDIHVQNVRLGLMKPSTHLSWDEYALVLRILEERNPYEDVVHNFYNIISVQQESRFDRSLDCNH